MAPMGSLSRQLTRRTLLYRGSRVCSAVIAMALAACGETDEEPDSGATPTATPAPERTPGSSPTVAPQPSPTPAPTPVAEISPTPVAPSPTPVVTPSPEPTPEPADPAALRARWRRIEPVSSIPAPRRDHSLVADGSGERLYLFGGHGAGQDLDDLWEFDVAASEWTRLQPPGDHPAARFGHSAAFDVHRERVVIFGGQSGPNFFSDVWAFETRERTWSEIVSSDSGPSPRYGSGDAYDAESNSLFVTHGFTFQGRFDDTWVLGLDLDEWLDLSPSSGERPIRRCLLRSAADGERGRILLFGGQADTAPFLGDLWAYDIDTRIWSELSGGPAPRNLYSLARRDDASHLLLFGGRVDGGHAHDLWLLDLETDLWHEVPPDGGAPSARDGHDAAWLSNSGAMMLFGGRAGAEFDDLWELTIGV
jgi:hypothetical protein